MKKMRMKVLALCFSMTLTVSALAGNGRLTIQAATSQESSGTKETTEKDSTTSADTAENKNQIIEIADEKAFEEFLQNCQYDSWSVGKTVKLIHNIDLSKVDFNGVAYFSGDFEGGGHTISNVKLQVKGSDHGFFRYLGKSAVVNDLKISGKITSEGSCKNIGGIAGVNYGTIGNCSFEGNVNGKTAVGAIAGINKPTGKIVNCRSNAAVTATNQTGGIVGNNEGLVSECTSECSINTDELKTTMDIGGVDIGTLNLTGRVIDRNDMGGIVGVSTGIVSECINQGKIGFAHTGYNVGGIAGRQSGKVIDCHNEGEIYGRKDVGGIVGQAEPYIESEYLDDKVNQVQDSVSSINTTVSNIASTMSDTSTAAKTYVDNLSEQYDNSSKTLSESLGSLSDSIGESSPEAQQYMNNIHNSLDKIDSIQGNNHILNKEQAEAVSKEWQNINSNLSNIRGTISDSNKTAEDFVDDISNQIKEKDTNGDIDKLTNTVDDGIQSVTNDVQKISKQIKSIQNTVGDTLSVVTGDEEYMEDISSAASAKDTDGVVSGSVNRGTVNGDLNVGGIVGTMNIEYDLDPEFDPDLTDSTDITLRSTVNNVVIRCSNYGEVTSKKNSVGGITGLEELGLVYGSESYGSVKSDTGDYAGGIAGNSVSAIANSYSLCNVNAKDYVGGIVGSGYTVKNCVSASTIASDGEGLGSIAGTVSEEGEVKGNIFVGDDLDGIDNINYAGVADEKSYEEVMKLENIPEGFHKVKIIFRAEDNVDIVKTIAYNGSFRESDLPQIPEKDGYYAVWPEDLVGKPMKENKTVEAEYSRWTESIVGTEVINGAKTEDTASESSDTENEKAVFLLEGKFYDDTSIPMAECDTDLPDGDVVYAYNWSLEHLHDKKYDTVKAHFYVPDTSGKNEIWYRETGSDAWTLAETTEDGSYLVADIPYEAAFALVHTAADHTLYYAGGGAAVVLLLIVLIIRKCRKRAQKK